MSKSPANATTKASKGKVVNRQELADIFGVALTTVDNWNRKGCPVVQKGDKGVAWQFNTKDVHEFLIAQKVDMATGDAPSDFDDAKLRKLLAETELAELELAKAKEEVVELPVVETALASAFAEVQARLRNLPGRVLSALIGETNEQRFKEVLLAEIDESLEKLSTLDLTGLSDEDDDEDDLDE